MREAIPMFRYHSPFLIVLFTWHCSTTSVNRPHYSTKRMQKRSSHEYCYKNTHAWWYPQIFEHLLAPKWSLYHWGSTVFTLCFIHEGQEPREAQDGTEDEAGGDGYVWDNGEAFEGLVTERGVDEVGIVVADKGCSNRNNNNNNNDKDNNNDNNNNNNNNNKSNGGRSLAKQSSIQSHLLPWFQFLEQMRY